MAAVALAARGERHPRAAPLKPLGAGGAEREEMSPAGPRALLNSPGSIPIPAGQEHPWGTAGRRLLLLGLRGEEKGLQAAPRPCSPPLAPLPQVHAFFSFKGGIRPMVTRQKSKHI